MKTYNIYTNLAWLNDLPLEQAVELFASISGSEIWARELARQRPFPLIERMFEAAESAWFSLPPAERIAAFSRAAETDDEANDEVVNATRLYRDKFGFIFVLNPEGKSTDEILAVCKARLRNSASTELQIAAEEHRKLIELRLSKVLER